MRKRPQSLVAGLAFVAGPAFIACNSVGSDSSVGFDHDAGVVRDARSHSQPAEPDAASGDAAPDAQRPDGDGAAAGDPAVSAGGFHTCVLARTGEVRCFGSDASGESSPPDGRFRAISAGDGLTCGLRPDDSIECWGMPTTPAPVGRFLEVGVGSGFACGLSEVGEVTCWGDEPRTTVPTLVGGPFASLTVGSDHVCALDSNGVAVCAQGAAGEDEGQATVPARPFAALAAGGRFTCGLDALGEVTCWGVEFPPPPTGPFESIEAGFAHVCGRLRSGGLRCWGPSPDERMMQAEPPFAGYSAGGGHTCVILEDESVRCAGAGSGENSSIDYGQSTPPLTVSWPLEAVRDMFAPFFEEGWYDQGIVAVITPVGTTYFPFAAPGRPLPDADTVFEGVAFGSVATSLLAESARVSGGLDFGASVQSLLPEWSIPTWPGRGAQELTLLHLLTRTSGLPSLVDVDPESDGLDAPYSEARLASLLEGLELDHEPGGVLRSSDIAFALAAQIVALNQGASFEDVFRTQLAEPLGLGQTSFAQRTDRLNHTAPPVPAGPEFAYRPFNPGVMAGGTSLWLNASDASALCRGMLFDSAWQSKTLASMRVRVKTPSGASTSAGWWLSADEQVASVNGVNHGYSASLLVAPQHRVALLALAAGESYAVRYVAPAAMKRLRGRPSEAIRPEPVVDVPLEILDRYPGTYRYQGVERIDISRGVDDRLRFSYEGATPVPLHPASRIRFVDRTANRQVVFSVDADGRVEVATVFIDGIGYPFLPE